MLYLIWIVIFNGKLESRCIVGFKDNLFGNKYGFVNPRLKSFIQSVKDAGGVLYLDVRKADGTGKLTGNEQWFHDLSNTLTEYTLDNKVTNGDFSDGGTGWISFGGSGSVLNNIYSNIGDGTSTTPNIFQATSMQINESDMFFIYLKSKVTNSDSIRLSFTFDGSISGSQIEVSSKLNPEQNVQYELYGINTITDQIGNLGIRLLHYYIDDPTANGKVMEVDGNAGVFAINMTDEELETLSEEEMLDLVRYGYFDSKNIQRANNGTLNNFAGNSASGWQGNPPLLRKDGIDDYEIQADTASLDITTAPLALAHTFYIPTGASDGWLRARDNVNIQYGLLFNSATSEIEFWLENVKRASVSISLDTWHNVIFFWDGTNITPIIDNVNQSTVGFVGTLTSQPNNYSGRRTSGQYLEYDKATESIYTGDDLNRIKKAEARISAEYIALNP